MIHLIYDATVYLNIDSAKSIAIDVKEDKLVITYRDSNKATLDLTTHPNVKAMIESYEEKEREGLIKFILFKVLEIIIDRLSKTDEKLSPIINLESVLNTLHKKSEDDKEETEREIIPVTTDADGNITKVLKEEENVRETTE